MYLRSHRTHYLWLCALSGALLLAGCGSAPKATAPSEPVLLKRPPGSAAVAAREPLLLPRAGSGRGGYYKDDGPGDETPPELEQTPDAEPRVEPYSKSGNRPYAVFGKTYTPITDDKPLVQRGVGSWYGKKFHGQKTSSGEPYDMYKMTAAHPTLPIPSYARVTNLTNGKQVIVRVNDRGPFHSSRIIDLSYTAALKLGYISKGSSQLEVERLLPEEIERIAQNRQPQADVPPVASPAPAVRPTPVMTQRAAVETLAVAEPLATVQQYPALPVALTAPEMVPASLTAADMPATQTAATLASAAPQAVMTSAYYLQFGAYSQAGNADVMRARLTQDWANKLPPIEVVQNGVHYRLFSGPFATREQALDAAQRVQNAGSVKPMVVQR